MKDHRQNPLYPTFGHALKTGREMRNLSLRQVEEATGISNGYISQLENDKIRRPSPVFVRQLTTLYGLGYEAIMARIYPTPAPIKGYLLPLGKTLQNLEPTPEEEQELMDYLNFIRVRNRHAVHADKDRAGGKPRFTGDKVR